MKKLRIGVIGVGRGKTMMEYCKFAGNAELVAICDKWEEGLEKQKAKLGDKIAYFTDYDEFLKFDMDCVMLANYANEHAPFAVKAMNAGKHVISEVLPCQTMKEAVEVIETIEKTGKTYCYAENYCYMAAPYEMKKLYRAGKIGEFEYAEGEYIHNCESIWPIITYGERDHWRNNDYATFYCTHSIGPIVHITGLRPVAVNGFELPANEKSDRMGAYGAGAGIEMIRFENGGMMKSIHGGLDRNSVWYTLYGKLGRLESDRESCCDSDNVNRIHTEWYHTDGDYSEQNFEQGHYKPYELKHEHDGYGHGGSDYYCLYNAVQKILGDPEADAIDFYEALDMFLPGLFAYRSILKGGVTLEIPNLRLPEEREKWRNDTFCTDKKVGGDQYVFPRATEPFEYPDAVYQRIYDLWREELKNRD